MFMLISLFVLNILLSVVVLLAAFVCSLKSNQDQEKLSPFECGFVPAFSSRAPFSIQFFVIALIFLVFDVELVLIFPYFMCKTTHSILSLSVLWLFLFILSLGLVLEWSQKMLEWYK